MADRIIQTETLQSIANGLRGGTSKSEADKIEVADFAEVASNLKSDSEALKGVIDKSITNINISDEVIRIGQYVFYNCERLSEVIIPDSVTNIGSGAFSGCTSLSEIFIPDSVTSIGSSAFYNIKSDAVINCAFPQGAVLGAPWGAPNTVTINYDVSN